MITFCVFNYLSCCTNTISNYLFFFADRKRITTSFPGYYGLFSSELENRVKEPKILDPVHNMDPFQSHWLSLLLAWGSCIPIFLMAVWHVIFQPAGIFLGLTESIKDKKDKFDGMPWWFLVWIALCFLLLSPSRSFPFYITPPANLKLVFKR